MSEISTFGKFDGIEMGVMIDGTPFATASGLAQMCGVTPKSITDLGEFIVDALSKPRGVKICELISRDKNFKGNKFFEKISYKNQIVNAYPDTVCMAVVQYYAFKADDNCTEKAQELAMLLMQTKFRDFVYALVGYNRPKVAFSDYTLSRITHHHTASNNPLPDGYFCLFDKIIEILQKFDSRIGYVMTDQWYDYSKGDKRYLEPDISLGLYFSSLFKDNFYSVRDKYYDLYNERKNNPRIKKLWNKKLINAKWAFDRAKAEKNLRIQHGIGPANSKGECPVDRKRYNFEPSPDSGRRKDNNIDQDFDAYCYANRYTPLFYDWLRDVFFKFCWRAYILERDSDGWDTRYRLFQEFDDEKKQSILTTTEGKLIQGYEFREIWERQLPESNSKH